VTEGPDAAARGPAIPGSGRAAGHGSRGPLEGIRVLDLTRLLPGAYGTSLLADLGAEVIKVEAPGEGDYMRWGDPKIGAESGASWVTDRNKSSLSLNLKDPRGVAAFLRLVRGAHCIVESFRPGVVDRLGVGYDAARAVNPTIVYCSISGYGQDGPLARSAGHDVNYVGRAGIVGITGHAEAGPIMPGVQVADVAGGGMLGMIGLLAALVHAQATGEGDHVDISMTDGAFSLLSVHLGMFFADGRTPGPERMLLNGLYPSYSVYRCLDDRWLTVGALEPQFFTQLCEGVGRPDLAGTAFAPERLDEWRAHFLTRTRDEWLTVLDGRDACVGPVNDFAEACADPQLLHRQMLVQLEHPTEGPTSQTGVPVKLRNRPGSVRTAPPRLGEQTRHYLAEAGYASAEIEDLLATGAAAEPGPAPAPRAG